MLCAYRVETFNCWEIFMKPILIAALSASLLLPGTWAMAQSVDVNCATIIAGEGTASRVEGSADYKTYRGKVPANLAKTRAIRNWQAAVGKHCRGYSTYWWRAKSKSINCDAGMGKDYCTATAIPRRKILN